MNKLFKRCSLVLVCFLVAATQGCYSDSKGNGEIVPDNLNFTLTRDWSGSFPDGSFVAKFSSSGKRIIQIAETQNGRELDEVGTTWPYIDPLSDYVDSDDKWCSEFVSWVYYIEGSRPFTGGPSNAPWLKTNAKKITNWFEDNSTFIDRDKNSTEWNNLTPSPGDYVLISDSDNRYRHSCIVYSISDDGKDLTTIDGNISGEVKIKERKNYKTAKGSTWVQGFGMRTGANIPIQVNKFYAHARSSGDNRQPYKAFDHSFSTFWRNRTNQGSRLQYIGISFNNPTTITKVYLRFGNHYARDYYFKFYYSDGSVKRFYKYNNTRKERVHTWMNSGEQKNVTKVRLYCKKCSADDYFSLYEMKFYR